VTPATLTALLDGHRPRSAPEQADLARAGELLRRARPWHRDTPLHFTASALIVHPPTGRVLLRRHERQGSWMHVGGHADPEETGPAGHADPLAVALREGTEETGLTDLVPWPDATLLHVVTVPVAAGRGEGPHHHLDLRFLVATGTPDAAVPERPTAPLRWLTFPEARSLVTVANVLETLRRAEDVLAAHR
jgi:8-oxo-dGTP pyrophosphatase MutT (NUDIX family)